MTIFLVVLVEPDENAWERISEKWPERHHIISNTLAFVAPEGISTAKSVRDAVGIDVGTIAPSGVVVPMDDHSGVLPAESLSQAAASALLRRAAGTHRRLSEDQGHQSDIDWEVRPVQVIH